jgi:hypothetical protein
MFLISYPKTFATANAKKLFPKFFSSRSVTSALIFNLFRVEFFFPFLSFFFGEGVLG